MYTQEEEEEESNLAGTVHGLAQRKILKFEERYFVRALLCIIE